MRYSYCVRHSCSQHFTCLKRNIRILNKHKNVKTSPEHVSRTEFNDLLESAWGPFLVPREQLFSLLLHWTSAERIARNRQNDVKSNGRSGRARGAEFSRKREQHLQTCWNVPRHTVVRKIFLRIFIHIYLGHFYIYFLNNIEKFYIFFYKKTHGNVPLRFWWNLNILFSKQK